MADFVHCNVCYKRPSNKIRYFITSCMHIICHGCFETASAAFVCPVCKKKAALREINKDLDPRLQKFFKPLSSLLTEHCGRMKKKSEFQKIIFQSLLGHYKKQKDDFERRLKQEECQGEVKQREIADLKIWLDRTKKELDAALTKLKMGQRQSSLACQVMQRLEQSSDMDDNPTFGAELEKLFSSSADVSRDTFSLSSAFDAGQSPSGTGLSFMVQDTMNRSHNNSMNTFTPERTSGMMLGPSSTMNSEVPYTPRLLGVSPVGMKNISPLVSNRKPIDNPYIDMMSYSKSRRPTSGGASHESNRSTPVSRLSSFHSISPNVMSSSTGSVTKGRIIPKVLTPGANNKYHFK